MRDGGIGHTILLVTSVPVCASNQKECREVVRSARIKSGIANNFVRNL